jgi:putative two-component system response regulator
MLTQTQTKSSLLLVDDAPENLELIGGLLGDLYKVKVAASGERALKILSGDDLPDLILLDVMMPGLSGWDVCRAIKTESRLKDIPIIFLTAKTA